MQDYLGLEVRLADIGINTSIFAICAYFNFKLVNL